jgi:RNA polymerase sigma-70 factor (ECF subfamily)
LTPSATRTAAPAAATRASPAPLEEVCRGHLARHRSGDPGALNALMAAIYPLIHRFVFRLAYSSARDAREDLVQNALEQVCRSIGGFEGRSRFSTFVFAICHKVVARACRYERVRGWFRRDAEDACLPQPAAAPDEQLEGARRLSVARAALEQLHVEERTAFVMHELEELPLDEVAVALSCSTRTVKRRLRCARAKLLRC